MICHEIDYPNSSRYISGLTRRPAELFRRNLQVANDFEDPRLVTMPKLQLVPKGIRRLGGSARVRLAVTPTILKAVKGVWATRATDYEMILLWAV